MMDCIHQGWLSYDTSFQDAILNGLSFRLPRFLNPYKQGEPTLFGLLFGFSLSPLLHLRRHCTYHQSYFTFLVIVSKFASDGLLSLRKVLTPNSSKPSTICHYLCLLFPFEPHQWLFAWIENGRPSVQILRFFNVLFWGRRLYRQSDLRLFRFPFLLLRCQCTQPSVQAFRPTFVTLARQG